MSDKSSDIHDSLFSHLDEEGILLPKSEVHSDERNKSSMESTLIVDFPPSSEKNACEYVALHSNRASSPEITKET